MHSRLSNCIVLLLCFLLAGLLPVLLGIIQKPKGSMYPYLEHAQYGYHYHAIMNYAKNGNEWTAKQPYVYLEHRSSITQSLYVVLGKVSRISHIDVFTLFAIMRFVGGAIMVFSIILLFHELLPLKFARLATIFYLFSEPIFMWNGANILEQDYNDWLWDSGDAIRRITAFAPHYSLSKGLLFIALLCVLRYVRKNNSSPTLLICSIVLCIISGIIYPMPGFILFFSVIVAIVVAGFLRAFGVHILKKRLIGAYICFCIACLIPILILHADISQGWPWNLWTTVELAINNPATRVVEKNLHILGLLIFLFPLVIYWFIKRGLASFTNILLVIWVISSFLLFPFANILKLSTVRLLDGSQLVPLVLLVTVSLRYVFSLPFPRAGSVVRSFFYHGFIMLFFINFAVFSFIMLKKHIDPIYASDTPLYLTPQQTEALTYFSQHAKKDTVVLAYNHESNTIPAFGRVRTILGGPNVFISNERYMDEVTLATHVLMGLSPVEEARNYISSRNIRYVYEQKYTPIQNNLYPSLLIKIFDNDAIVIYEVKSTIAKLSLPS
jgi:hypothetical protein